MADSPIYQFLLDESNSESSPRFEVEEYTKAVTDKDKFIQWVNNQTRLNAFNMNSITRWIQSYGNWVGKITADYLNSGVIKGIIENNAGWSYKSRDVNSSGEVFSDYINNSATGKYSSVFGNNNLAENDNQFVIGKFNEANENGVFLVGWGNSEEDRKNIFTVLQDGRVQIPAEALPQSDGDLVNKGYIDSELDRVKQLNQWLGTITVSSETFNDKDALQKALNDEVEKLSPSGRTYARNGDLITVIIEDKKPTDPQYPEIWIFLETKPSDPESHEGTWQFYSSQQELLNASKTVKGLVQIGNNIDVSEGLISVPVATDSLLGVVKSGKSLENTSGQLDVKLGDHLVRLDSGATDVPISTEETFGVVKTGKTIVNTGGTIEVKTGNNIEVSDDGSIGIPLATSDKAGVVTVGDNINIEDGKISVSLASSEVLGLTRFGENVVDNGDGSFTINKATESTLGLVKVGDGLSVDSEGTISIQWIDV